MQDMSWINDLRLKDMDPMKKEIILNLAAEAKGKSVQQALPILLKAQNTLKEKNKTFSQQESALIMEILTTDMSPEEKTKLENMKQMFMKMRPLK